MKIKYLGTAAAEGLVPVEGGDIFGHIESAVLGKSLLYGIGRGHRTSSASCAYVVHRVLLCAVFRLNAPGKWLICSTLCFFFSEK